MIVKYPTGLYTTILPKEPADGGNVTYTVSMEKPPRSNSLFTKISPIPRRRTPISGSVETRRPILGQLLFTESDTARRQMASAIKQYEVGQLIGFDDPINVEVGSNTIPNKVVVRHDTNVLDLASAGLSAEIARRAASDVITIHKRLQDEANVLKEKAVSYEIKINELQKSINESAKALKSLQTLTQYVPGVTYEKSIVELTERIENLYKEQEMAVQDRSNVIASLSSKNDEIRKLAELLR